MLELSPCEFNDRLSPPLLLFSESQIQSRSAPHWSTRR
jgi:hypothetical protein